MIDKSVEYKNVIMRLDAPCACCDSRIALPEGFSFKFFTPQEEAHWARIETSVLEFSSEDEARAYFEKAYLPHVAELTQRCIFITNPDNLPIATANAWYAKSDLGYQAALHWVAVCPEYQGMGLGRAIVRKALSVFAELEHGRPIWLKTQTQSHPAIKLYHSLGFNLVRKDPLANTTARNGIISIYQNDFTEALEVLRPIFGNEYIGRLSNDAM